MILTTNKQISMNIMIVATFRPIGPPTQGPTGPRDVRAEHASHHTSNTMVPNVYQYYYY